MTEYSYLWNGIVTGDAIYAPYNATEFNAWLLAYDHANTNNAYVIGGYLNDLNIIPAGNSSYSTLRIFSGAAVIAGTIYISDEEQFFNIASNLNTGYYRYDTLVLCRAYVAQSDGQKAQTVRLKLLVGVESSTFPPTEPTLTQDITDRWEVKLATVLINSTTFTISADYVRDYRKFLYTWKNSEYCNKTNLVKNSEFMAFSGVGSNLAPECWELLNTPTTSSQTRLSPMTRGRCVGIGGSINAGIYQKILINPFIKTYSLLGVAQLVTGAGTGGAAKISLTGYRSNGLADPQVGVVVIRNTGVEYPSCTLTFDNDDVEYVLLQVELIDVTDTPTFYLGQLILVPGYVTGGFKQFHELLPFKAGVGDANWNTTAKSSGTTAIDLTASFGNLVLAYTKAVMLLVTGNDSGSAAGTPYIRATTNPTGTIEGELYIGGMVNDRKASRPIMCNVQDNFKVTGNEVPSFNLVVSASGVGTFDALVKLTGILT